jgi:imidazolonepropionase-like amidohydrolase
VTKNQGARAFVIAGVLAVSGAAAADDFVVQAGKVVTAGGKVLENGGSVLVSGTRIVEVREGLVNPWNAEVRARKEAWLVPGFVESHAQTGLERANEQAPNTPFVSVLDGLDPLSEDFEDLLREGVTTIFVVPGDETLVGGQGLVLKPVGRTAEEMIVKRDAGMKIALAPRRGTSRMAQMAELRRALDDAKRAEGERSMDDPDKPVEDPRQAVLLRLLRGEIPAVFACDEPVDCENAAKLMEERGLKGFVTIQPACRRAFALLKAKGILAVLPPDIEPVERDPETLKTSRIRLARECRDAGVPVVLQAEEGAPYGRRSLWFQAAQAVSQGLTREEAFQAVTENPAKLLGVADRVGAVAPGRDANFALWTGDPLDPASWVDAVYLEGRVVYERSKDKKLARLMAGVGGDKR